MTATASNTSQAVAEWVRIFPKQATETYTSSVTFMKQLTVVAVSTITYLKNAFPEDSYTVESFGGVKLRILKKKCRDEWAQFLSTALTHAFEAFDKKYLHQLAICFYENECKLENLIEYHIFEYTYNNDEVTMNFHSKNRDNVEQTSKYTFENVRERIIHLIRACMVIMQSCQNELPSTYDLSLRIYYNDDTPADYQAPGFLVENDEHLEPTLVDAVKLGWVETPFHRLVAHAYMRDHVADSREVQPSQNAPILSNELEILSGSEQTSESESRLHCPCDRMDVEQNGAAELLTCVYCKTQQHPACFGVLRAAASQLTQHCCARCYDADPTRTPTDQRLVSLSYKKKETLCIYRRVLQWCAYEGRSSQASGRALQERLRLSTRNTTRLLQLLYSFGALQDPPNDIDTPLNIVTDRLQTLINKYFNMTEDTIVDRLMAESFASQESLPDPIAEVLSPLKKVSLQSTSNIGQVIDNPMEGKPTNEDETLKQYREAVMSSEDISEDFKAPVAPVVEKKNRKRNISDRNGDRPTLRAGVRTKRARATPKQ